MAQTLAVNEIFYSIQGEASHAGLPCIFVRTMACQMRCTYCDTEYAFYEGHKMSLDDVLSAVRRFPCRLVEFTGGEPLLQKDAVIMLMNRLLDLDYEVLLETGGGISLDGVPDRCLKIVDVKCPDSGETKNMNWSFLERIYPNTQLKFVLSSAADYAWAREWLQEHRGAIRTYPVYFSPVTARLAPQELAERILADALPVRLQLQLHKHIWPPEQRGV